MITDKERLDATKGRFFRSNPDYGMNVYAIRSNEDINQFIFVVCKQEYESITVRCSETIHENVKSLLENLNRSIKQKEGIPYQDHDLIDRLGTSRDTIKILMEETNLDLESLFELPEWYERMQQVLARSKELKKRG
ncbi:hypothetical protein [Marininema halotolerans]|uniref:Uncharacterized protein n=1 Tax=Marininema halotolerans TaxID=1155944 RepID=A0A1I6TIE6_9BACL|nr:hypothetical protein [Marininema halotolerans]SFS88945.1 hypothetical protein SAMN05444972_11037 [Marininema halotolerans]